MERYAAGGGIGTKMPTISQAPRHEIFQSPHDDNMFTHRHTAIDKTEQPLRSASFPPVCGIIAHCCFMTGGIQGRADPSAARPAFSHTCRDGQAADGQMGCAPRLCKCYGLLLSERTWFPILGPNMRGDPLVWDTLEQSSTAEDPISCSRLCCSFFFSFFTAVLNASGKARGSETCSVLF